MIMYVDEEAVGYMNGVLIGQDGFRVRIAVPQY